MMLSRRALFSTAAAPFLLPAVTPRLKYRAKVHAAFVRRKGPYGMRWPGEVFDGEAARKKYAGALREAAARLNLDVALRPEPLYSAADADAWLAEAKAAKADGLLVMLLDRQEHAWPTASKAVDTKIPTVVFAPVGTAFTTNTAPLAKRDGVFIASTSDFDQAVFGLKMLRAGAWLREMRFVVLKGKERRDAAIGPFGTKLRYVPASEFLEEYERTPVNEEVKRLAQERIRGATRMQGATPQDVIHGIKSYIVARTILQREGADGITMDCLGALGQSKVSLPCISWSTMLDHGIPAACEADLNACVTHALVQFLFDKPGFQQDPVAESARGCLIGAHCTCPTKLAGFDKPPEPYFLSFHHGKRDAVPVPRWKIGQRITVAEVVVPTAKRKAQMIASAGKVVENISVPPAGGCVVSVMVELDGVKDVLDYPGFHQLFFYGDHKRDLAVFAQLYGLERVLV